MRESKIYKHEQLTKEFLEWANYDIKKYKPFVWLAMKLDYEQDLYNRKLLAIHNEHFKELYEKQLEINKLKDEVKLLEDQLPNYLIQKL